MQSNGNMSYCKTRMGSEMDILRSWEQINPRPEEKSDKILEVVLDNQKSHAVARRRRRNLFHSCHLSLGSSEQCCSHSFTTSKESSCEAQSFMSPMKYCQDVDEEEEESYYAAVDGGATNNNRGGGGPFTPTKSDCSRSGYSDYYYPSYMAYTESSKAKMRSLSAPKQRPQYEKTSPNTKRYSIHGYGDSRTTTATVQQKVSSLHANFTNKVYPGSGRLDRLGMPVTEDLISFSGGHWHHHC